MIHWSPEITTEGRCLDMRADAEPPWNRISIDYQHGQIPVPGIEGMYSETVRGVMEGMKLVGPKGRRGKINCGMFVGPGRPRPIKEDQWCSGFSVDGRSFGYAEASKRLLIPAYMWILYNKCHDLVARVKIMARKAEQDDFVICCSDQNPQFDPQEPNVSSAAIFTAFINDRMAEFIDGLGPNPGGLQCDDVFIH